MTGRFGLEIRGVVTADAPGLAELLDMSGFPIAATRLAARLEALREVRGTCLVACVWGPPSGLALVHWRATLADDRPVARIEHLLVRPDERRRGVGRLLVKAAAQAARSAGCGVIEVAPGDERSGLAAFCDATGFVASGAQWTRPLRKS